MRINLQNKRKYAQEVHREVQLLGKHQNKTRTRAKPMSSSQDTHSCTSDLTVQPRVPLRAGSNGHLFFFSPAIISVHPLEQGS